MRSNKVCSENTNLISSCEKGRIYYIFIAIIIFLLAVIAWLLLGEYRLLPLTPTNIGLNKTADLGRVMYETGTLIVCLGALLITVIAFIVPFSVIMWSEIQDSYFSLFVEVFHMEKLNRKKKFCEQIKDQTIKFRQAANFAQYIFRGALMVAIFGLLVLGILSTTGWPCWNISHYLWMRGILFVIFVTLATLIGFLIYAFLKYKPEIMKGEKHLEIMREVLKSLPNEQNSNEK